MNFDLMDSLSPYEVAVLTFTSPKEVKSEGDTENMVLLTSKEAYLWAGAIAHVLVNKPDLEAEQVLRFFRNSVYEFANRFPDTLLGRPARRSEERGSGTDLVRFFLHEAGLGEDLDEVVSRTENAIRSLEWRGIIEDPFTKKIGGFLLSVVLVLPVGFTSAGPNYVDVKALTWEYTQIQNSENHQIQRDFHVKVVEITKVILDEMIPFIVKITSQLASNSTDQGVMDTKELQMLLRDLRYYHGPIDNKNGPLTIRALKRFQHDHNLSITGYLDARTLSVLRASQVMNTRMTSQSVS